jgi:hypothetical protein
MYLTELSKRPVMAIACLPLVLAVILILMSKKITLGNPIKIGGEE